ncbi:MAG: glycosyl transferase group 1 [Actinomycetia bacterium]|nr:glycosyl transferase group 1 [Actinomycetes bacterium]
MNARRYLSPMPTTVLVDAWHLGGSSANRGIGTYLRGLLPLLARDPSLDLVCLAEPDARVPDGLRRRRITRRAPNRFAQREHDLRLPFDLARAARAERADVVFSPADNPPSRCARPWVQMLHDLIPMAVTDASFDGAAARWRHIGPRLRAASVVCTNSRSTAADATRLLGVDPSRVRVAPLGVDARFRPPAARRVGDPPRVLYVGEYGPHKGFAEAFAVAGRLADAGLAHRLAMVGFLAPWYEPVVRDLLASAPHPERVDLLGYVDDVVASYQQADALIVTSRYEGFCLPALEAMACGTPVVAFANSAIPEVVEGGGLLVPDGDVDALAATVATVLTDRDAWQKTSDRGIEQARAFTWERCARVHADALQEAAATNAPERRRQRPSASR